MLLKDYINKIKGNISLLDKRQWLNYKDLIDHVYQDMPNSKIEEWKNFKTSYLKKINWEIYSSQSKKKSENVFNKKIFKNSIVFKDGNITSDSSASLRDQGINIFNIQDYIKNNPNIKSKLYSDSKKYAEARLSGKLDKSPTYFISLNSILSTGVVIEIEKEKKINDLVSIIHTFSNAKPVSLINPYIVIIGKKGSQCNIQEIFYNIDCWVNNLTEIFLESGSKMSFTRLQSKVNNGIKTSSFNCHLESNAKINLKILNRENCKEDIRIFLNKEKANAIISGIIFSSGKSESDIFCKTVHNGKQTYSNQKWRLISSDNSKASINGKICINKNSKGSDASFYSKSLILDNKSASLSKPELEILEDDVKCKHGASFGEIDKDVIFYMQSRGIKKKDAVMMLVHAFIDEIGLVGNELKSLSFGIVQELFENINKNE